jgi:uncharacterized protein YbaR (Trm112 family)
MIVCPGCKHEAELEDFNPKPRLTSSGMSIMILTCPACQKKYTPYGPTMELGEVD